MYSLLDCSCTETFSLKMLFTHVWLIFLRVSKSLIELVKFASELWWFFFWRFVQKNKSFGWMTCTESLPEKTASFGFAYILLGTEMRGEWTVYCWLSWFDSLTGEALNKFCIEPKLICKGFRCRWKSKVNGIAEAEIGAFLKARHFHVVNCQPRIIK